jgi:hypothetical protein
MVEDNGNVPAMKGHLARLVCALRFAGFVLLTGAEYARAQSPSIAPLERPTILLTRPIATEPNRADIATSVLPVEGGALITGWTSIDMAAPDGFLMRVDGDGNVVWRRNFGGEATDLLWSVLPDGRGGWTCLGFTGSRGAGSLDGWMLGLDAEGKTLWEKTYGGPGEDRLTSFQPTADGWIAVGQTSGRGAGGLDALVVRIDRDGNEISSWLSGGPSDDRAFGIQPLPDGGCLIGGMGGGVAGTDSTFDAFVTRLGPDGRRLWHHETRRPGFQVVHDLRGGGDGTYVAYGYGHVDDRQGIDGFALRMRDDGRVVRETTFGGTTYDRANHAEPFADGSAAVVGYSQRPGATDDEEHWDMVVYALDPAGEPVWSGRFGGAGVEFGRGIGGTMDDLWVVGHTTSGRPGSALLLVRLDLRAVLGGQAP